MPNPILELFRPKRKKAPRKKAPRKKRDVSQTMGSNPRMRRLLKKAEESER